MFCLVFFLVIVQIFLQKAFSSRLPSGFMYLPLQFFSLLLGHLPPPQLSSSLLLSTPTLSPCPPPHDCYLSPPHHDDLVLSSLLNSRYFICFPNAVMAQLYFPRAQIPRVLDQSVSALVHLPHRGSRLLARGRLYKDRGGCTEGVTVGSRMANYVRNKMHWSVN